MIKNPLKKPLLNASNFIPRSHCIKLPFPWSREIWNTRVKLFSLSKPMHFPRHIAVIHGLTISTSIVYFYCSLFVFNKPNCNQNRCKSCHTRQHSSCDDSCKSNGKRIAFTPLNTINVWEEISKSRAHQLYFLAVESLFVDRFHLKFNYINFSVNFKSEGWFSLETESELLG